MMWKNNTRVTRSWRIFHVPRQYRDFYQLSELLDWLFGSNMPRKQLNLANFKCREPFCAAVIHQEKWPADVYCKRNNSFKLKPIIWIVLCHFKQWLRALFVLSQFIHPSIHPSIYLSTYPFIYPSIHPSIHGASGPLQVPSGGAATVLRGGDKEDQKDRRGWVKTEHRTPPKINEVSLLECSKTRMQQCRI